MGLFKLRQNLRRSEEISGKGEGPSVSRLACVGEGGVQREESPLLF